LATFIYTNVRQNCAKGNSQRIHAEGLLPANSLAPRHVTAYGIYGASLYQILDSHLSA